jgi:hypothetical protein
MPGASSSVYQNSTALKMPSAVKWMSTVLCPLSSGGQRMAKCQASTGSARGRHIPSARGAPASEAYITHNTINHGFLNGHALLALLAPHNLCQRCTCIRPPHTLWAESVCLMPSTMRCLPSIAHTQCRQYDHVSAADAMAASNAKLSLPPLCLAYLRGTPAAKAGVHL